MYTNFYKILETQGGITQIDHNEREHFFGWNRKQLCVIVAESDNPRNSTKSWADQGILQHASLHAFWTERKQ